MKGPAVRLLVVYGGCMEERGDLRSDSEKGQLRVVGERARAAAAPAEAGAQNQQRARASVERHLSRVLDTLSDLHEEHRDYFDDE